MLLYLLKRQTRAIKTRCCVRLSTELLGCWTSPQSKCMIENGTLLHVADMSKNSWQAACHDKRNPRTVSPAFKGAIWKKKEEYNRYLTIAHSYDQNHLSNLNLIMIALNEGYPKSRQITRVTPKAFFEDVSDTSSGLFSFG